MRSSGNYKMDELIVVGIFFIFPPAVTYERREEHDFAQDDPHAVREDLTSQPSERTSKTSQLIIYSLHMTYL